MAGLLKNLAWRRHTDHLIVENRKFFKAFDTSRPLAEYSFVVYDTELTGLDKRKDEIISIGGVRIRDMRIDLGETFHCYIQPENLDPTQATLVHRITPEQLKQAPPMSEVLPKFLAFIGTDLLVGHYIGLDMSFLNRATRKALSGTVGNPCVDTMRMAKIYRRIILGHYHETSESSPQRYNLQSLTAEFDLPFFEAHDALEDSLQTAYLFLFLANKLAQEGVATLADLYRAGRGINWATF